MKKSAAILALGAALGAAGGAATSGVANPLKGTVYVRFVQELPDGGTRDLGRTGCYELGEKVKATVEACAR